MRFPLRLDLRRLLLFLFLFILFHLAGSYLHPLALSLSCLILILPLVSLCHAFISAISLRFYQDYSNNHPAKGDTIHYKAGIENPLFFPTAEIKINFFPVNHSDPHFMKPVTTVLSRHSSQSYRYNIDLPYRGIYELGLDTIEIRDLLGLLTFVIPAWHQTFYVYPHLYTIKKENARGNAENSHKRIYDSRQSSLSGLREIREYRDGDPWNRIDWKKTAAIGTPFIKEMDSESGKQVFLFLDRIPQPGTFSEKGEDTALEILLAAARYYLEREIRVTTNIWPFPITDEAVFNDFYRSTLSLGFDSPSLPTAEQMINSHTIIITSRPHYFLNHNNEKKENRIFSNLSSLNEEEKKRRIEKEQQLQIRYPRLSSLRDSSSIEEIIL